MNPQAPPAWTTYVNVDSADDVAAKVTANGGAVFVPPMDVMDVGRMAICADPTGAVFGIWQAGTNKGAQVVNETNTWCWSELLSTDTNAARAFYTAVFGWGTQVHGDDEYTEWQVSGRSVGGMMPKPPMMPAEIPS